MEVVVGVKPYSVYFTANLVRVHIAEKGVPVSMLVVRNFGDIPFRIVSAKASRTAVVSAHFPPPKFGLNFFMCFAK